MRTLIVAALAASAALGQKLETQPLDNKKVIRVETAKDHLTVIEVADPVTMVAVGNTGAFTVERRDNKVFIKPTEDGAQTNLFIWTNAGRYAYELLPAASVAQMHFAIDQSPTTVSQASQPEPAVEAAEKTVPLPREMLTKATPITMHGERETAGRVAVTLRDLFRQGDKLYVRYAVHNQSAAGYQLARPSAWLLSGVRAQLSLVPLAEQQLGEKAQRSLKADAQRELVVLDADHISFVPTGGHGFGWVAVEQPPEPAEPPAALKLEFAADAKGPVQAVLVLRANDRREVANAGSTR
ncbi:MAG: TrbG/VirB9 family P-type conjugative transfer protein [Bryobacteraceae bacterium]|nr:TrbG/VirB9 family P-type conjugative transfer protein [Bryobacteraceae bacterium]